MTLPLPGAAARCGCPVRLLGSRLQTPQVLRSRSSGRRDRHNHRSAQRSQGSCESGSREDDGPTSTCLRHFGHGGWHRHQHPVNLIELGVHLAQCPFRRSLMQHRIDRVDRRIFSTLTQVSVDPRRLGSPSAISRQSQVRPLPIAICARRSLPVHPAGSWLSLNCSSLNCSIECCRALQDRSQLASSSRLMTGSHRSVIAMSPIQIERRQHLLKLPVKCPDVPG